MSARAQRHTGSVTSRFAAAAATYERCARIQRAVATRVAALAAGAAGTVNGVDSILDAGCGTGLLTRRLRRRFPRAHITAIDLAAPMLQRARLATPGDPRIKWKVADAATFAARQRYPIIASSSALHWMVPIHAAIGNLAKLLAPGGILVAAVMLKGTLRELHTIRLRVAPDKAPRRPLPSRAEVERALRKAHLRTVAIREEAKTIRYPSALKLLRLLHEQGLTGGDVSRGVRPLTRGELNEVVSEYERRYRDPRGGVRATYRVLYFTCRGT